MVKAIEPGLVKRRLAALKRQRIPEGKRRAAVLLPFLLQDGEPAVLFTRRSETVGTHKGHVSFPGGMADPGDAGPEETALRETEEEIGHPRDRVEVLGLFHDVRAITGVPVTPVVGWLGELDLDALVPSPAEIDDIFTLRFDELLDPEQRYHRQYEHRGDTGRFTVFDAGPHPVWGLTAHMLEEVLREVLGIELDPPRLDPPRDWP